MKTAIERLHEIVSLLGEMWPLCAALFVAFAGVVAYVRTRKQILFESWVNMYDSKDADTGRSLADLLLFKLGYIKRTHSRSTSAVGTWNIYRDVPAFRQGLDEDVKLLGSVELGKYGSGVSTFLMLLSRVLPIMFRPARLKGSIHKHGEKLQLLATLDFFRPQKGRRASSYLWEVVQEKTSPELVPEAVERLAFRIYLDLTGEDLFKTWEAFRAYTTGLSSYISYVELQREADYESAQSGYLEALKLEPNNAAIKYSLGVLEYHRWEESSNEEAISYFRGALSCTQVRLRTYAHSGLANAYLQKFGRFGHRDPDLLTEAMYYAKYAVELEPEVDIANKALAYACHMLSEYQATSEDAVIKDQGRLNRKTAIKYYRRAYKLNPSNFIAHNNLANLYIEWAKLTRPSKQRSQILGRAIQECEAALQISPQYFHAHDNLGNAHYERREFEKARDCFKNALRYKPDYPEAWNDLAVLFLEDGYCEKNVAVDVAKHVKEALRYHLEAVSLPQVGDSQRRKLCHSFRNKWLLARHGKSADVDDFRDRLAMTHCSCLREFDQLQETKLSLAGQFQGLAHS